MEITVKLLKDYTSNKKTARIVLRNIHVDSNVRGFQQNYKALFFKYRCRQQPNAHIFWSREIKKTYQLIKEQHINFEI